MDLARLAKVWALTVSPVQGEATAARERARLMMEREGLTLADVPRVLRGDFRPGKASGRPPARGPDGRTYYDMADPAHVEAYEAWRQARDARRAPPPAPEPGVLHLTEEELRQLHEQWNRSAPPAWKHRVALGLIPALYVLGGVFSICRAVWRLL